MYRYKLGDIRIIYEIHNDISTIRVKSIETRGGAYKQICEPYPGYTWGSFKKGGAL